MTVPRIARAALPVAGSVSVAVGAVRSSCHVQLAGDASMLPARSVARMSSVCEPSAGVDAERVRARAGRPGAAVEPALEALRSLARREGEGRMREVRRIARCRHERGVGQRAVDGDLVDRPCSCGRRSRSRPRGSSRRRRRAPSRRRCTCRRSRSCRCRWSPRCRRCRSAVVQLENTTCWTPVPLSSAVAVDRERIGRGGVDIAVVGRDGRRDVRRLVVDGDVGHRVAADVGRPVGRRRLDVVVAVGDRVGAGLRVPRGGDGRPGGRAVRRDLPDDRRARVGVSRGDAERDRVGDAAVRERVRDRDGRRRVVDAEVRDRSRGGDVAGNVVRHDVEVVEAVCAPRRGRSSCSTAASRSASRCRCPRRDTRR